MTFAMGRWRGEMRWRDHSAGDVPTLQGWGSVARLPSTLSLGKHNAQKLQEKG